MESQNRPELENTANSKTQAVSDGTAISTVPTLQNTSETHLLNWILSDDFNFSTFESLEPRGQ